LITAEAQRQGKPLLPIDSEHNAVHQCLRGGRMNEVERVWLTAFRRSFSQDGLLPRFAKITVEQALNHPTWKMGRRITIDSATLMNKGFEVIEACRLFNLPASKVGVIVHPPVDHPFDGGVRRWHFPRPVSPVTDMRLPILYALTYPGPDSSDLKYPVSNLRSPRLRAPGYEEISLPGFSV